jgi:anti-sigma factor ChrR (cupin superfamily)
MKPKTPVAEDIAADPQLRDALLGALEPAALPPERKAALRERVLAGTRVDATLMRIQRADEGQWLAFLPKVHIKPLRVDRHAGTQTTLWRLEPGARIPEHDHSGEEECLILEGSVLFDRQEYGVGDFLLARPGLHHSEFTSSSGALLMIRGELSPNLSKLFARAGL